MRWSDNGHEGLYFPGSDARVDMAAAVPQQAEQADDAPQSRHVTAWHVQVDVFDDGPETTAHAVLHSSAASHLDARGTAHRRASDPDVPEIGDEIAVARALRHLADRLLASAADDIAGVSGQPVTLQQT